MKHGPAILLGLGIVLGLSSSHGGLSSWERITVILPITAAALWSALREAPRMPPAIFLPVFALVATWPTAVIPRMGIDIVVLTLFATIAGAALAPVSRKSLAVAITIGAVPLAASVIFVAAGNFAMIGRAGLSLPVGGLLGGANAAGVALAAAVISITTLNTNRFIKSLAAGLFGLALFLTGSRTAVIALLGGLFFLLRGRQRLLLILIAAIALLWHFPKLSPEYITNSQRLSMIAGVMEAFGDRPFFGHGPWTFPVLGQKYLSWPKWELHPHSLPLRILFESGILGIAAWYGFVVAVFRRLDARAAGAIFVTVLAGSVTDDLLWIPVFLFLFFLASSAMLIRAGTRGSRSFALVVLIAGSVAAFRPYDLVPDVMPHFRGSDRDPWSLRVLGNRALDEGDLSRAHELFERASMEDPQMIFGPNLIDLSLLVDDTSFIERARALAPVLTAWHLRETTRQAPSPIDRHYGMEFPDPLDIIPAEIPEWSDPAHWRHHRYRGAQAMLAGDTRAARRHFENAIVLARSQYGSDPALLRLAAEVFPEHADTMLREARRRSEPADPYEVFAPLIYRHR